MSARSQDSLDLAAPQVIDDDAEVIELIDRDLHIPADCGLRGVRRLVRLFDGHNSAVRPGGVRNRAHRISQGGQTDVELLAPRVYRPEHATDADGSGIRVRQQDMQLQHAGLNRENRILPAIKVVHRHKGALGRRRNLVQLLTLRVELRASLLSRDRQGMVVTPGKDEDKDGKD